MTSKSIRSIPLLNAIKYDYEIEQGRLERIGLGTVVVLRAYSSADDGSDSIPNSPRIGNINTNSTRIVVAVTGDIRNAMVFEDSPLLSSERIAAVIDNPGLGLEIGTLIKFALLNVFEIMSEPSQGNVDGLSGSLST